MKKLSFAVLFIACSWPSSVNADIKDDLENFINGFEGDAAPLKLHVIIYSDAKNYSEYFSGNLNILRLLSRKGFLREYNYTEKNCPITRYECVVPSYSFDPLTQKTFDHFKMVVENYNVDKFISTVKNQMSQMDLFNGKYFTVSYSLGNIKETAIIDYKISDEKDCDYNVLVRHFITEKTDVGEIILGGNDSFKRWMCIVRSSDGLKLNRSWNAY